MYTLVFVELSREFAQELQKENLAYKFVRMMTEKNLTFASAESCTGGLIGGAVTSVSGSSEVYAGGIITYTNDVKINILGVDANTIAEHTEVSAPVAHQMAKRARDMLCSDIGVSATGFAGPTGGNENDPVGTVYVGVCAPCGNFVYRLSFFDGASRDIVRNTTVSFVLKELAGMLL